MELGLIHEAVTDEDFDASVSSLAFKLAGMPTRLGLTKKALHAGANNDLREIGPRLDLQFEAAETEDYAEGVQAFLNKRPANFQDDERGVDFRI